VVVIVVGLRQYSRSFIVRNSGKDDVFMAIALVCALRRLLATLLTTSALYNRLSRHDLHLEGEWNGVHRYALNSRAKGEPTPNHPSYRDNLLLHGQRH
jgi:hypothetical protein